MQSNNFNCILGITTYKLHFFLERVTIHSFLMKLRLNRNGIQTIEDLN
jgi:hypothetical protein